MARVEVSESLQKRASLSTHGGHRVRAGRKKSKNKVVPVVISIKGDIELQEKWYFLRNKGAFITNKEFLAHLLHLEEERCSCLCDK